MKKLKAFLVFVILTSAFAGLSQNTKKYKQDNGLIIEIPEDTLSPNRYTSDNKTYKAGYEFIYNFKFINKDGDEKYLQIENGEWCFQNEINPKVIKFIKMIVLPNFGPFKKYQSWYDQTVIRYELFSYKNSIPSTSTTGLVENEKNIWMHPPRIHLFKILELNPFPYIKFPVELGNEWSWSLRIGSHWSDERWRVWDKEILNVIKYKVVERDVELNMKFGNVLCTKIEATAESSLGKTVLYSYYNSKYGFVKMVFENINGSTININLEEVVLWQETKNPFQNNLGK